MKTEEPEIPKDLTLRQRVNRLQKEDPEFYDLMVEWRDEWKARKKDWLDRLWVQETRDALTGKKGKRINTIDDACQMMWDQYVNDDEWFYGVAVV